MTPIQVIQMTPVLHLTCYLSSALLVMAAAGAEGAEGAEGAPSSSSSLAADICRSGHHRKTTGHQLDLVLGFKHNHDDAFEIPMMQ